MKERRALWLSSAGILGFAVVVGLASVRSCRQAAPSSPPPPAAQPPRLVWRPQPVDLGKAYNARLNRTWHPLDRQAVPEGENDLADLPSGLQTFLNTPFDVRGIVQVSGRHLANLGGVFPERVGGIPVGKKCRRLYFLHATSWREKDGVEVGAFVVHFEDGTSVEVPLVYGRDVRDWWWSPEEERECSTGRIAWEGSNSLARKLGRTLRIYKGVWPNPQKQKPIREIEFRSAGSESAPFLVALTAEVEAPEEDF